MNTRAPNLAVCRRRSRARGVAAIEYALLLIPLVTLCFGIAEYGRAIYEYNAVAKAVREAVRVVAQANPADATYPAAAAKCLAVYGNTTCAGNPLVPGLTTDYVSVCDRVNFAGCTGAAGSDYGNVATAVGTINLVEVRISGFAFPLIGLPFLGNTGTTMTFGPIHATMRQVS